MKGNASAINPKRKKLITLYVILGLSLAAVIGFSVAIILEIAGRRQAQDYYASMFDDVVIMTAPATTTAAATAAATTSVAEQAGDAPATDARDAGPATTAGQTEANGGGDESETEPETEKKPALTPRPPTLDFSLLKAKYPGIAAWIYIYDTPVNYPVMQGVDNEYYLSHLPDGTENKLGSIFIDFRNDVRLTDISTLIYGHNMRSGDMFGSLKHFSDQEYYEKRRTASLFTPEGDYDLLLFAGYFLDSDFETPPLYFQDETDFMNHVADIKQRSIFYSDTEVVPGDQLVYLCTCTNSGSRSSRLILAGKLAS